MKRREFLKMSSLASGTMLIPGFLSAFDQLGYNHLFDGKRLIVIQLSGGLDGLSAAVPYRNDIYYAARNRLAIPSANVLKLDDEMGFNPVMDGLRNLYDDGLLTLINNVGYPNANRSHFRSMDIWHSASDENTYWTSGWLGRYLDNECLNLNGKPIAAHTALEIDDTLSLALKGHQNNGMAVRDIKMLHDTIKTGRVKELNAYAPKSIQHTDRSSNSLSFLYKTLASTTSSIDYLKEHSKIYSTNQQYPGNAFGKQLKNIAELIISGVDSKIYYSSLSGFDTHAAQEGKLNRLLKQFSDGLASLVKDLKINGQLDDTLIMVFSEFGRRVKENGSGGTDHGAANNVYLLGNQLKRPGIFNGPTDLSDLDQGDVRFKVDFREIYSSILNKWLGADDTKILNRTYKQLDLIT